MISKKNYYKEKSEFLQKQIYELMNRYDKGGTLIMFPNYDEWYKKKYVQYIKATDKIL